MAPILLAGRFCARICDSDQGDPGHPGAHSGPRCGCRYGGSDSRCGTLSLRAALFAAPAALAFISLLSTNLLLYGNVTEFGYREESFTTPFPARTPGLDFQSEKGNFLVLPHGADGSNRGMETHPRIRPVGGGGTVGRNSGPGWSDFKMAYVRRGKLLGPPAPASDRAFPGAIGRRGAGFALGAAGGVRARRGGNCRQLTGIADKLPGLLHHGSKRRRWSTSVSSRSSASYRAIYGCHEWRPLHSSGRQMKSENPLWRRPPWINRFPEAVPPPYARPDQAILNPWPLRLALPESRWKRGEFWYMRALLEAAIRKYQLGDLPEALRLLDRGLAIDPADKEFLAAKGMVYSSMPDLAGRCIFSIVRFSQIPAMIWVYTVEAWCSRRWATRQLRAKPTSDSSTSPSNTLDLREIRSRLERLPK